MTRKAVVRVGGPAPPPWRTLQLGVGALHSSGVRFVAVWLFSFIILLFYFVFRPALASPTRGVGAAWGAAPSPAPRLALGCRGLDAALLCPLMCPPTLPRSGGLRV